MQSASARTRWLRWGQMLFFGVVLAGLQMVLLSQAQTLTNRYSTVWFPIVLGVLLYLLIPALAEFFAAQQQQDATPALRTGCLVGVVSTLGIGIVIIVLAVIALNTLPAPSHIIPIPESAVLVDGSLAIVGLEGFGALLGGLLGGGIGRWLGNWWAAESDEYNRKIAGKIAPAQLNEAAPDRHRSAARALRKEPASMCLISTCWHRLCALTGAKLRTVLGVLSLLLAGLLLLVCWQRVLVPPTTASTLNISLRFEDQYTSSSPVLFSLALTNASRFALPPFSAWQGVKCNGVALGSSTDRIFLPHQPAGGAYHCSYTDEQGHATTITIPVTRGALRLIAPTRGAQLAIPRGRSPTATMPIGSPRSPDQVGSLTVLYTLPAYPRAAMVSLSIVASCGQSAKESTCGFVTGHPTPLTSVYTLTDANWNYGYGFDRFVPGPGFLILNSYFSWFPPDTGFRSAFVEFYDELDIPVMWTR